MTPKGLVSFISFVRFYSAMIPYFSALSQPLHALPLEQQDKRKLKYTDAELQAFKNVKRAAAESIALSPLTVDDPLFFATDVSKMTLLSCIWQKEDKTNKPCYLAAVSLLFDKHKVLWSLFRKEVSAMITMLSLHNWMFRGAPKITVYCDSKAVGFLRGSKTEPQSYSGFLKQSRVTTWK